MESNQYQNKHIDQLEKVESHAVDNRTFVIGGLTLILLALLALSTRYLLPDINPFILAGFGSAAYVIYLGIALRAELVRLEKPEIKAEPVFVEYRTEK